VSYYLDSTNACASPGNAAAALTIGWKDETSAKNIRVPLAGAGISGGNSLALGGTSNFGGGSITLWSAGNAGVTYSAGYTACATGVGSYAVRIAVEKLQ
jgi:6-phosphogluconate dehydrogenase